MWPRLKRPPGFASRSLQNIYISVQIKHFYTPAALQKHNTRNWIRGAAMRRKHDGDSMRQPEHVCRSTSQDVEETKTTLHPGLIHFKGVNDFNSNYFIGRSVNVHVQMPSLLNWRLCTKFWTLKRGARQCSESMPAGTPSQLYHGSMGILRWCWMTGCRWSKISHWG